MDSIGLINQLGTMGINFYSSQIGNIMTYYSKMIEDERVMSAYLDSKPHTIICFSITDDWNPYFRKGLWEYLPHNPYGKILYVEKLVSLNWNLKLRNEFERMFLERYPQIECCVAYRPSSSEDRKIVIKRRLIHV